MFYKWKMKTHSLPTYVFQKRVVQKYKNVHRKYVYGLCEWYTINDFDNRMINIDGTYTYNRMDKWNIIFAAIKEESILIRCISEKKYENYYWKW